MNPLETQRRIFLYMFAYNRTALAQFTEAFSKCMTPELSALAGAVTGKNRESSSANTGSLNSILKGWNLYYQASYESAGRSFLQAWKMAEWSSWAALGLGKVCSDVGEWEFARRWLLMALRIARHEEDFARMAECHGALGEVFFRCGLYRLAYEQFTLDAALLPAGSGHRGRLMNYQAATLSRLGLFDSAEPRLWGAAYETAQSDPSSTGYSLASLEVLSVLSQQRSLYDRVLNAPLRSTAKFEALPRLVCEVIAAYWSLVDREPTDASKRLERIVEDEQLRRLYPVETTWLKNCLRIGGGNHVTGGWQSLCAPSVPAPPQAAELSQIDVTDQTIGSVILPRDRWRFAHLFTSDHFTPETVVTFLKSTFL